MCRERGRGRLTANGGNVLKKRPKGKYKKVLK
jgi:hypothetical protein